MKRSAFYLPLLFFALSFILLILPGNDFPKAKIFDIKGLDKIVHTCMFLLLTFLFCRSFRNSHFTQEKRKIIFVQIALGAFVYGILMEFVQKYFVAFRSFELGDIIVDGLGALIGMVISIRFFVKH